EPDSGEGLFDQPRRLDLLEAQLRMLADPLAEPDDLLGAPVDGRVHALLQLVLRHEDSFPALFYPPWTTTTSSRPRARSRWPWLGGPGALAGGLAIVAVVAAAAAVHAWARREGGVGFRHSLALAVAVYAITWGSFVVLGPRGAAIFAPVWLPVLLLNVVGI